MAARSRLTTSALIGVLLVLAPAAALYAQPSVSPGDSSVAETGSVAGEVRNEHGEGLAGAVVSVVGASITAAITDEHGRFEVTSLPPGEYQVRAHFSGYVTPKGRPVHVRSGVRTAWSFSLRQDPSAGLEHTDAPAGPDILAAGVGVSAPTEPLEPAPTDTSAAEPSKPVPQTVVGWRLRHLRRGVLRTTSLPGDFTFDDEPGAVSSIAGAAGRAVGSSARMATSFFADVPFTGQLQLLTANSFDAPQQMLSGIAMARGIAYVKVGAPVGNHSDWTVRGAITQADLASWFVGGTYRTRVSDRRSHDLGLSYSTQRYVGGNPLALRDVSDGTRNAADLYAYETLTFSPAVAITYGGEYARYDYLDRRDLISPRATLWLGSADRTRLSVTMSSRADAPGAGEFLPPTEHGLWLPPQRTFSSATPGAPLRSERTTQVDVGVERAFGATRVAVHGFRQRTDDQMVTIFGVEAPEYPGSRIGHYVVGTAGDVDATGGRVSVRSSLGERVTGTVAYSVAVARMTPGDDLGYVVWREPALALRPTERLHNVSTALEANVPETATRVLVFYRVGNGYASLRGEDDGAGSLDSRFDVQVRQSLPFLNFTNARWEMLVAIRNFFRDPEADQSVYDELLTVRAPKRLVGGVSLHF